MKNSYNSLKLLLAILLLCSNLFAQNGNSTFEIFSENGDPFILVMNGIQQNNTPQTNVKLQNLAMSTYKIRVIFQNTDLGALNDKINLDYGSHQTYSIKLKKIGALQKNILSTGNIVANDLAMKTDEEAAAKKAQIENENSKYVIRMINKVPVAGVMPPQAPPAPQSPPSPPSPSRTNTQVTTTTTVPANQTTVVQQTTTTTGNNATMNTNSNMGGANVSMNINLGGMNATSSYSETTTTTVHSSSGAPTPTQQNVYVMPGYSGPTGCPWPMSDGDFNQAKNSVNSKSFEDSKLTMAKQIFDHNCMLSSQVRDIMTTFDFEATKLEFAKYAYGRTYDIGNYYKVNDVFDFESSISDLNAYINNYRR